ncbi:MAG TPA: MoaD/ThiS family protein [Burkholderiaceae bacterium]|nr:MoaD/ThiS family protein [Burkholderiaceae bacterium]HYB50394.1 MoaD/ThiS family protein [Burkholderiaceae bacterium]
MRLTILYFARMREAVGRTRETVEPPPGVASVGELRTWMISRGEPWASAFAQVQPLRTALDLVVSADEAMLHDGAEVAYFPPVTGG